MTGAGRQHRHVAWPKLEHLARRAAETRLGAPARYAERLVDHGVIVHVGKNAVAPHIAPAVCGKRALDDALGVIGAGDIDGAGIDQKRQARIVGYQAVVAEHQHERFTRSARLCHEVSSESRSRDMNAQAGRQVALRATFAAPDGEQSRSETLLGKHGPATTRAQHASLSTMSRGLVRDCYS